MHALWCNSFTKKTYDINYLYNAVNYDFFNKYYLSELWLSNFTTTSKNWFVILNNQSKNYNYIFYIFANTFKLFIKYGIQLKLFTSAGNSTTSYNNGAQLLLMVYYYKFLFITTGRNLQNILIKFDWNSVCQDNMQSRCEISKYILLYKITLINNIITNYFIFFNNFIRHINNTSSVLASNPAYADLTYFLGINFIYKYSIKNISYIFIYNWFRYATIYHIVVIMFSMLVAIYLLTSYRISLWWYFGILYLIKILYANFFITNILRISKKLWILVYIFLLSYVINLFLYSEINIAYISIASACILTMFSIIILYFIYKYNIFFLIFLELSITVGKSIMYAFKQYFRDILNILAFLLRLFLLFLRLNIYDGLDDFFDSYYIFIGDFDSYDYLEIIYLYGCNIIPNAYDNLYDKSVLNYEEIEFYLNIFYIYSALLFKFLIFLVLLLEGGFRLLLAAYIFILVILEINNFNVIFNESKSY